MPHTAITRRLGAAALLLTAAACGTDAATGPTAPRHGGLAAAVAPGLSTAPVLHDQALTGSGILSPNNGYNSVRLGDDFTVPAGDGWEVGQLMIAGRLNHPYTALPVAIHADADGRPGAVVASATLTPTNSVDSPCCSLLFEYLFELPSPVTLAPGTYWLVAEVNTAGEHRFDWHATQPRTFGARPLAAPDGDSTWSYYLLEYDLGFAVLGVPGAVQAQAIAFDAIAPAPAIIGATATLGATASSGLAVTYTVTPGSASVCAVTGATVTYVGVGTCEITAEQAGNASYSAAEPVTRSLAVNYAFSGFAAPVDDDVVNLAKAGRGIPLRWRVTDANGSPITNLTAAAVSAASLACVPGAPADQVEEYAGGSAALQNLGNGYYQLNWKTPSGYARSCKTLHLDLGEGSGTRTARFQFTK